MKKIKKNGSECSTGDNTQVIENVYIKNLQFLNSFRYVKREVFELENDPNYQLLKKLVEYSIKEYSDFHIFSNYELENFAADITEESNDEVEMLLIHLEDDNFIKVLFHEKKSLTSIWIINLRSYLDEPNLNDWQLRQKNPQRFKFRAECVNDIIEFINAVPKPIWMVNLQQQDSFPDATFEFTCDLNLKEILFILYEIPDGHVMMDTLNPIENYTGDRKYINWACITIDDELISNWDN